MLRTRLLTALLAATAVLAILFAAPAWAGQSVVAALLLAGAWEWSTLVPLREGWQRVGYVAAIGLCACALIVVTDAASLAAVAAVDSASLAAVALLALVWWLVALAGLIRYPIAIPPAAVAISGALVLAPLGVVLWHLLGAPAHGPWLVFWLLGIVWAADAGAYAVGRMLGRRRLAPRVSPGKTWEGVAGGVLAGVAVAVLAAAVHDLALHFAALLGVAMVAISIVGDLAVSMFKRNVGVKDSGRLFPGHGGVLDRIDSLSAAAPLYLLALTWLGVWP